MTTEEFAEKYAFLQDCGMDGRLAYSLFLEASKTKKSLAAVKLLMEDRNALMHLAANSSDPFLATCLKQTDQESLRLLDTGYRSIRTILQEEQKEEKRRRHGN